jgi:hypothetical protein
LGTRKGGKERHDQTTKRRFICNAYFMFYFILMYKEEEDNDGPDFIFDVFSYSKSI